MKRIKMAVLLSIFIISALISCNDENEDKNQSQSAVVFVEHYYAGRRAPSWEVITVPSVAVKADITGNPIPSINYVQIGDKQLNDPASFYFKQGSIHFSSDRIWMDSIPEPKFDPLFVKINSSYGEFSGSISIPDTIHSITVDAADSIALGTPITISWTGSNADYYEVQYYHNWMEMEGYWLGYSRDTIVTSMSVTLSGSKFLKDGDISEIEIYPFNGPKPEAGAKPNMIGTGFGYLYSENNSKTSDRTVAIGKGIDYDFFDSLFATNKSAKTTPTDIHQKIKDLLKR